MSDTAQEQRTFTRDQVSAAVNRACDDIMEAVQLPDTGTVDALNLLTNASLCYLDGTAEDLETVVNISYTDTVEQIEEHPDWYDDDVRPLDVVLGWIR